MFFPLTCLANQVPNRECEFTFKTGDLRRLRIRFLCTVFGCGIGFVIFAQTRVVKGMAESRSMPILLSASPCMACVSRDSQIGLMRRTFHAARSGRRYYHDRCIVP